VAVDLRSLAKLLVAAAGHLSHVFLAVVFFSSLYWFIFFKQQTFVHTVLPSPDQAYTAHLHFSLEEDLKENLSFNK
jgi:hypothetical protein